MPFRVLCIMVTEVCKEMLYYCQLSWLQLRGQKEWGLKKKKHDLLGDSKCHHSGFCLQRKP